MPVHNEGARLQLTLECLRDTVETPHEIVVVDDGSDDGAPDHLRANASLFRNVRVVRQERTGPAGARNLGVTHASGEIVVFLDAHCFGSRGWMETILEQVARHPDAMVVPALTFPGDPISKMYGLRLRNDFSVTWIREPPPGIVEVPVASAACLAMTRMLFNSLGRFDRMRIYGLEDVELSVRAWLCGYRVLVEPRAEIAHVTKVHRWDEATFDAFVYNLLRMILVHLDAQTNRALLLPIRPLPSYRRAMAELNTPEFWDWYELANRMKMHEFSWLAAHVPCWSGPEL